MLNWIYNWLWAAEIRHQQLMAVIVDNHRLLIDINGKVNRIMTSQAEAQARLEAAGGKIDKIAGEVSALVTLVAELRAEIENAGALSAGVTAALEAVETKLQGLDDQNADAPTG